MITAEAGQGNGSTITVEPMVLRPSFGAYGDAPRTLGHFFVSQAALENRTLTGRLRATRLLPVRGTRKLGKRDMLRNDALPDVRVDRASFRVHVDGREATVPPATNVPLSRRYLLI